jgi:hypothetical protein
MSDVYRDLSDAQNILKRTLNDALTKFKLDDILVDELRPYMHLWGNRTVHDFMQFCANSDCHEAPDLYDGEMKPYNLFLVLYPLYI